MSDNIAYIGRNLNFRTAHAVENFQMEVSRIQREAAAAGALHSSRTFVEFSQAGLAVFEREALSAMQLVYNHSGKHTGEVYDQVAYCLNQMVERIVQEVRGKANQNDRAFGGGYASIVDRMLVAMREKRERLLDDFQHGMMGDEKLKNDGVINVVQSDSPGAVLQVGSGNFNQSAYNQNHQSLVQEIDKALASAEFAALKPDEKVSIQDIADVVKDEAAKPTPEPGKLKRWGDRLVKITEDLGLKVVSGTIASILLRIYVS